MIWGLFKKKSDATNPPQGSEAATPAPATQPDPPPAIAQEAEPLPAPQMDRSDAPSSDKDTGFLGRLFDGLKKSSGKLTDGIAAVFVKKRLDKETLGELEELLIRSDMGAAAAARIAKAIAKDRFEKEVSEIEIKEALAAEVATLLAPRESKLDLTVGPRPRVVLMVGVNGSGKTTTIGKLCALLAQHGAKVVVGAGDTFRAAAVEQLKVWADRSGAAFVAKAAGADAAGVAFDAVTLGRETGADVVLIDTAGRLQNKTELMAELAKIVRVIRKVDDTAPHETLLVLDATVGQNALSQVEAFRSTADVTGLVMTKLDTTAKGGVLIAIGEKHALPIHFVGVGERAADLQPFNAISFARALVGLSDRPTAE
jgi:fused signal recognition particle receptor